MGGALCKRLGIHHVERKEREEPTAPVAGASSRSRHGLGLEEQARPTIPVSFLIQLSFPSPPLVRSPFIPNQTTAMVAALLAPRLPTSGRALDPGDASRVACDPLGEYTHFPYSFDSAPTGRDVLTSQTGLEEVEGTSRLIFFFF
jgi:hypothetical protein